MQPPHERKWHDILDTLKRIEDSVASFESAVDMIRRFQVMMVDFDQHQLSGTFERKWTKHLAKLLSQTPKAAELEGFLVSWRTHVLGLLDKLSRLLPAIHLKERLIGQVREEVQVRVDCFLKNERCSISQLLEYVERLLVVTIVEDKRRLRGLVEEYAKQFYTRGHEPLVRSLHSLVVHIENEAEEIQRLLYRKYTFHLDVDALLRVRDVPLNRTTVLFDTNFIRNLLVEKNKFDKEALYDIQLSSPRKIIFDRVLSEASRGVNALASRSLLNYLQSKYFNARIESFEPTQAEVHHIITVWRTTTKGRHASERIATAFANSADMTLLVYALRHQRDPIIMSADTDIIQVVRAFRSGGAMLNTIVVGYENGQLRLAA